MNLIKLFIEDVALRLTKWTCKVLWNIIKPYVSPALAHPKLFPVHLLYFMAFYSVRTWLNEKEWTEKLGIKKLSKDTKEQMDKLLVIFAVLAILANHKGKLIPKKAYSVTDLTFM